MSLNKRILTSKKLKIKRNLVQRKSLKIRIKII